VKQIISIILSIFLLVSSTGITYAQHYCGELIMMEKLTFNEAQLSCGMAMVDDACGDENEEDHECCADQYTTISTDDNFAHATYDFVLNDTFAAAFISVFVLEQTLSNKQELFQYSEYNPPPILKNIPVLYETFLI
jgi:hypothetical protein